MQHTEQQNRRDRIEDEILADAYGPYEQQIAWHNYLSDMLDFPFRAQVRRRRRDRCELLREVEVLRLEEADEGSDEQRVEVIDLEEQFSFSVPLEELQNVQADDETYEAVEDWKYWKRDG